MAPKPPPQPLVWHYVRTQWQRLFGLNISQIDETLFLGGQFRAQQWPAIRALGVRAVLSMQAEHVDTFAGPPPDRAHRLVVPDFYAPSVEQLAEGVRFISAAHADQLPVFIHCHAGVGRAPLMTAAYLVAARNLSVAQAVDYLSRQRPIVRMNRRQRARLAEWAAQQR